MKPPAELRRIASVAWLALVLGAIAYGASGLDWARVAGEVRSYTPASLAIAFAIGLVGYAACAGYDLVARHCTGHRLSTVRTAAISFVGYCFSLNLGALLGSLAFRYRLYGASGLRLPQIGQVISLSVVTNWSGYVVMAGTLLCVRPPELPEAWGASPLLLRGVGVALLSLAFAYVLLCWRRGGDRVRVRGSELTLPTLGVAGVQLVLSSISWGAIGALITWLLPGDLSWFAVMPVLLVSAIAGVASHVPGGVGVVEAVFVAMLGHRVPATEVLGALIAYRAVYYLAPFLIAAAIFAWLEATASSAQVLQSGRPSALQGAAGRAPDST